MSHPWTCRLAQLMHLCSPDPHLVPAATPSVPPSATPSAANAAVPVPAFLRSVFCALCYLIPATPSAVPAAVLVSEVPAVVLVSDVFVSAVLVSEVFVSAVLVSDV
jgi:hypothetical protein